MALVHNIAISNERDPTRGLASQLLVFSVGGIICGADLGSVCEVSELPQIKKIPNVSSDFVGLCKWRSKIVGVLDLCSRWQLQPVHKARRALVIFKNNQQFIGAIVERILAVESVHNENILQDKILSELPIEYVSCVVMRSESMMTILNIGELFRLNDVVRLENTRMTA